MMLALGRLRKTVYFLVLVKTIFYSVNQYESKLTQ